MTAKRSIETANVKFKADFLFLFFFHSKHVTNCTIKFFLLAAPLSVCWTLRFFPIRTNIVFFLREPIVPT